MIMAKKLKDWTLGEVQEECKRRGKGGCYSNCPLVKMCNGIANDGLLYPSRWDLTDMPPTLTPDELAVCRLLKSGGVILIKRHPLTIDIKFESGRCLSGSDLNILFPSLRSGESLDLSTMDLQ